MTVEYSRFAVQAVVYADGEEIPHWQVLDIQEACGAAGLARAMIADVRTEPTERTSLQLAGPEIEIVLRSSARPESGDPTAAAVEKPVFWGKLSGCGLSIGRNESATYEARASKHHFGKPLDGMLEYDARTNDFRVLPVDLEFNPTVNFSGAKGARLQNMRGLGVVRGNMTERQQWGDAQANAFLDPARVFTAAARRANDGGSEASQETSDDAKFLASDKPWTLPEAVYYLCWALNEDETNIKNPTRADLKLLDDSPELLRDVVVPMGTFLPEALDLVLHPFGFNWHVNYVARGDRRIVVTRRGDGDARTVKLQRPDETLDPAKTNVESCELGVGIASLVNEVHVYGARKLIESTFELKRAWSAEFDGLDILQLSTDNRDWKNKPQYHRVWRDWVLNEGGDYNGVRSDYKKAHDLTPLFSSPVVARRRRFHPCLTLDKDRVPVGQNGYVVEFYNGFEWLPADQLINGSYEVLTNECGIRFTGVQPPQQLVYGAASTKVRITASVYADERLLEIARRAGKSVQQDVVPVVYDAENSFHFRKVDKSSRFYEQVQSRAYESSQIDDTLKLYTYAQRLKYSFDQQDVSGTIVIPNLEVLYHLGDSISKLEGRDIDFDIGSIQGPRSPQVVARRLDIQQQKQILTLETMRNVSYDR